MQSDGVAEPSEILKQNSMQSKKEIEFNKYKQRGSLHWREMVSRDPRVFNAFQEARYGWILKTLGDIRGKKILDLGSGDGSFAYQLAKAGAEVIGIDSDELGVKYATENLESKNAKKNLTYSFVVASAYQLPFENDTFDAVVCCDVIEHLNEPERMLGEAYRVLKAGGKFVVTTPYRLTEVPPDKNHVKEYYPGELKALFESQFKDVGVRATHHMLWRSIYVHAFRRFGNRPLGRWGINMLYFVLGWNPFMIPYDKVEKWDAFANICAWGSK